MGIMVVFGGVYTISITCIRVKPCPSVALIYLSVGNLAELPRPAT